MTSVSMRVHVHVGMRFSIIIEIAMKVHVRHAIIV